MLGAFILLAYFIADIIMDQIIADNTDEAQIKSETQNQTQNSEQLSSDLDANLVDIVPNATGPP